MIDFMPEHPRGRSTRWLTCITIDPMPFGATGRTSAWRWRTRTSKSRPTGNRLHLQPVFCGCRIRGGAFAEGILPQGLCLPSGSSLREEDRLRVANVFREVADVQPATVRFRLPPRKAA